MPNISAAAAQGRSSAPSGFIANAAMLLTASRDLDIRELAAQIERCPAHSAQAVHRLLLGPADPDQPSHLHAATSRGDLATVQGLLRLIEQCSGDGRLTKAQCHQLLRGDGARRGGEPGRDGALATATAGSGRMFRPLMLHYVRAFIGDRISAGDFESLMTGAAGSLRQESVRHYFIHCVWAAYDEHWLGSAPLVRMMTLAGHDMRARPGPNAIDLRSGELKPGCESTSSHVLDPSDPERPARRQDEAPAKPIEPTLEAAKQRRRLLAPPMASPDRAQSFHDHPVDAARGRRRLLAAAEPAPGFRTGNRR